MIKKILLFLLLIPTICQASPPSRVYTYTTGNTIQASENTSNEDAIFNYLSTGVDTIKDGVITTDDISASAAIPYSKLSFSNDITATDIATGGVGTTEILDATIVAADIATGGVESTEILDGTILNIDVNASAGIVDTKLATISTAGKVNTSALTTTSQAAGDVMYNDGTNWVRLAKDAGKYLKSGASAVSWETVTDTNTSNVIFSFATGGHNAHLTNNVGWISGNSLTALYDVTEYSYWVVDYATAQTFLSTKWKKIAGVSTVTVYGYIWTDASGGHAVTLTVDIGGQSGTANSAADSTGEWVTFTIDVSGLSNGTVYDVSIKGNTTADGVSSNDPFRCDSIIAFGS